ncbi:ABC transporter ATP-binding protein [Corynebacterium mendelii]|uniref:ABC transporter ATP-binding protein n=1 Tax=Corynebacterium mendelii TaxID=2765362 RepID=A0A939DXW6_9CORY|nr:ABC transporter ATP-binding protein [Corynebacterium mendelii]MBN9643255.1 ABC transporter ATP-binding protein [Corynebacterium mendelii]
MTTTPTTPALTMRDVVLTFPDGDDRITAVDHATFTVNRGELIAVTGPSGSGKSSLLAVASTLIRPDSGSIVLGGTQLAGISGRQAAAIRRERLGIVFQQPNLLGSLTAIEQLEMTRHLVGWWKHRPSRKDTRNRARDLLGRLDVADAANRTVSALSGGQRQRVNIARALMHSPELLVVDEPTSALDSTRSQAVMDLLLELVREENVGTLLVTHDRDAAARADRELVMTDGVLDTPRHDALAVAAG